nr:hypothetical protein [Lysinibacillus timonensis]
MGTVQFNIGDFIATLITLAMIILFIVFIIKLFKLFELNKQHKVKMIQLEKERTFMLEKQLDKINKHLIEIKTNYNERK